MVTIDVPVKGRQGCKYFYINILEISVSKSIGLACSGKEIYHFCFVLLCIQEQIPCTSPLGGLYLEGQFNGGFFALRF